MQAIQTYFIGPTNHRGSRIVAKSAAGKVTLEWDHALNPAGNHRAAARALAEKYGWSGEWVCGGLADGSSVFVNVADYGAGFRTDQRENVTERALNFASAFVAEAIHSDSRFQAEVAEAIQAAIVSKA